MQSLVSTWRRSPTLSRSPVGKDLPAGPWDAEVTMSSGLLERVSSATLTFPGAGAAIPDTTPGWPYALGALLLLLLAVLSVFFFRRRRT